MTESKKTNGKKDKKILPLNDQSELGPIRMDDDVIVSIVTLTVLDIDGVAEMVGGMADGLTGMFGKKSTGKGVKVDIIENDIIVDVSILVKYGVPIPELAHRIQRAVMEQIEAMMDIKLVSVNVYIQGIRFSHDETNDDIKEAHSCMSGAN